MNQPKINSTAGCALPPPNEMILKWAAERPNEVYLKQIINRQFVELLTQKSPIRLSSSSAHYVGWVFSLAIKSHWYRKTAQSGLSAIWP